MRQQRQTTLTQTLDKCEAKINAEYGDHSPQNDVDNGGNNPANLSRNPRQQKLQDTDNGADNDKLNEKLFNPADGKTREENPLYCSGKLTESGLSA